MIIPLLIIYLLNLRKLRLFIFWQPYLIYTVSWIVEASHDEGRSTKETLPLGRLTEVSINAHGQNIDALHLAVLLSMIPTVRKSTASRLLYEEPYSFPYRFHGSAIKCISLNGCVDPSFVKRLTLSTRNLQSFEFTHLTKYSKRDITFRRLSEILLRHAGASLLHLSLLTEDKNCADGVCRKHTNLFLGSLRGFQSLKKFVTSVEMFIQTRDSDSQAIGIGTVQRMVSQLPASLQALVLHKRVREWKKDVLHEIFQGLRTKRQTRLPNLKLIDFVPFPGFDRVMPGFLKATCRELGIKVGYTLHHRQNLHYRQVLRQLDMVEELPWIAVLEKCCPYKGSPHCEWVSV